MVGSMPESNGPARFWRRGPTRPSQARSIACRFRFATSDETARTDARTADVPPMTPTSTVDTAVEANVDATYPVSQRPSIDRLVGVPTTKEVSRPVLKKRIPRR